ncbi:MAG: urate hydroxylase PuuD [Aquabacterium sp.]|uniref:urate hydroxylase PuuD n=1 Tax=Aquabacterium sp. TaxID=1872578 RepID=UPI00272078ED|nr:urate hydroxylase PuuD [Aquabacterium sp.]MDO9002001.1 urate hydroxylase PuuD [Aquabacterium sp.]
MFADAAPWLNYALDWANLLLRWAHVVVAIAWIGSSFYFVWLDNSLTPPPDQALKDKGVGGELWAVHGGGFYNPQKYLGAPKAVPAHLHWFYWESYSTWLTGFALFTVLYLFNAGTFLIDKSVFNWTPTAAVGTALGFLAGFWFIYDWICRTVGRKPEGNALVGALVCVVVVFAAWAASQLFAGRAALLLVGAMMATTMSANVFFWIIPGQRTVVESIKAGQPVDPVHGQRGKQRSVHNTYFTMPVLIAMLSNHYSWVYSHAHNWLALVLLMLAGALIRHFFVARHKTEVAGAPAPWRWAVAGGVVLLGVIIWLAPTPRLAVVAKPTVAASSSAPVASAPVNPLLAQVNGIVQQRCLMCHNAELASKGVALHTPELIAQHKQQIYQQAVMLRAMPMNNATKITEDERGILAKWYEAGP